ncbi:MAG: 3-phosphoshikimate 1-carboxyvinyltransferase [Alphaproteobacteria bacterium]|nr:3-phosphoshikimate 1-carboxyvinyltransferase [Alphaproteobacteria bacterium]
MNQRAVPLVAAASPPLAGRADVPGDKSISHRALMFGAVAVGRTEITGLLEGEDVLRTAQACRAMGARIERISEGRWTVEGVGVGGLGEPAEVLDLGNSGTSTRLLLGLVATHDITAFFTGDASLCRRPMARVTTPLSQMGARFVTRSGERLPLAVVGAKSPLPITYRVPVASAQVKSAVLLAGLNTPGETTVIEPVATRDHSETMLRHFGATVTVAPAEGGATRITLAGQPELKGRDVAVPRDPSSAAFPLVAALIVPGAKLHLPGIGINPLRAGLIKTLREMGAAITLDNQRIEGGETVADLTAAAGALTGIEVPAERAPTMIDEYPALAVAAAFARGRTVMRGLAELKVKESNRLAAIARGLEANGVKLEMGEDSLVVEGGGGAPPPGGGLVETQMDHRIAMAFLMLGLATKAPVRIDDGSFIDTSFPGFVALMNGLGARIAPARP